MIRWTLCALLSAALLSSIFSVAAAQDQIQTQVQKQQAFGRQWGNSYSSQDWNRMYHYPYVYYPQNFWGSDYYRSSQNMYNRYPPEMQIPVYNKQWQNDYPTYRKDPIVEEHQFFPMFKHGERHTGERYYRGNHFEADVF
jgi:hypothetical protein